jgi:hypothetical protein
VRGAGGTKRRGAPRGDSSQRVCRVAPSQLSLAPFHSFSAARATLITVRGINFTDFQSRDEFEQSGEDRTSLGLSSKLDGFVLSSTQLFFHSPERSSATFTSAR